MVSQITLTVLSTWTYEELKRTGWLDNIIIDRLYTITSTGQWIARTDTSGRIATVESNSSTINSTAAKTEYELAALTNWGRISWLSPADATKGYLPHFRRVVTFTSNVGGTLDADVDLTPAAVGGYYYCVKITRIQTNDAVVAGAATLVIQDASASVRSLSPTTMVANVPISQFEECILYGAHDNEKIFVDTTSSGLGATKQWILDVEYWLET